MGGPHPALAQVRTAVRRALADVPPGPVLAAVSGGADSFALAAALAFVGPRSGRIAGAVVVDHGLQHGSADVAERAAAACRSLGLDPVIVRRVVVPDDGSGPEAAARSARYAALDAAADDEGAVAVLLGHTLDDQAESVLLALARGSGTRSLAGMAPVRGRYRRPLLDLPRTTTRAACAASGLEPWQDPHNTDPAYARVRARRVLATLERELGPGVVAGLARSATLARADADALDAVASSASVQGPDGLDDLDGLDAKALAALPAAIRRRVLRTAALRAGTAALTSTHLLAVEALVTDWHGQGAVHLPGGHTAGRRDGRVRFAVPESAVPGPEA